MENKHTFADFLEQYGDKLASIHQFGDYNSSKIEAIAPGHMPQSNRLVFIKAKKYFDTFLDQLGNANHSNILLIVSEKALKLIDPQSFYQRVSSGALMASKHIDSAMCDCSAFFYQKKWDSIQSLVDGRQLGNVEIHPSAQIAQDVFIGENVIIGANTKILPGCVIMSQVELGENTILFPNVTVYPFTKIEDNCRIHANTCIGSDGFGYSFYNGAHQKLWQMGGVHIESDVEIGSNCSVDTGTFSPTVIKRGCKLDNLVQIAHNCYLDEHVVMCGQAGTAGSSRVGAYSFLGGQTAVSPQCELGPQTRVAGAGKVTKNFLEGNIDLGGHPARPLKEWLKGIAQLRKLSLKGK
jgi:UDP-3-O-[3-hydroxymyristoyl] glucosamine N-acyltransferase